MKKTITAVALVAALSASVSACADKGDNKPPSSPTKTSTPSSKPPVTRTPTPTPTPTRTLTPSPTPSASNEPSATTASPSAAARKAPSVKTQAPEAYYANCTEVRAAGAAPIHRGDPGYSSRLDRDGDGTACES